MNGEAYAAPARGSGASAADGTGRPRRALLRRCCWPRAARSRWRWSGAWPSWCRRSTCATRPSCGHFMHARRPRCESRPALAAAPAGPVPLRALGDRAGGARAGPLAPAHGAGDRPRARPRPAHRRGAQAAARATATPAPRHPPGRLLVALRATPPPRSRSRSAPCSRSRPLARAHGRRGRPPVRRRGRRGPADPRQAHAQRRPRRLPPGDAVDRPRRRRAARGRAPLAPAPAGARRAKPDRELAGGGAEVPCAPGSHSGSERALRGQRWRRGRG